MGKTPLKTVLKNFLDHFHNLETSLQESSNAVRKLAGSTRIPPLSLYAQEFLKLKELTEFLKSDPSCPMIEGNSDVNKKKNRYKDILPYDNSRVVLSEYPGVPGSDYINANYVRGSSGNQRAYIASQGPLPDTLVDFWRMIWETEVLVIVMACNEKESDKYKCERYWPEEDEKNLQYGNITVEFVKERQVCPDFLVRTFKMRMGMEERTICQFHYTTWPDHGVPSSVHPILELVRLMRDVQSTESRPILVHCSAGCGRTGTICSIDFVWALLRTGKLRQDFSLFEIISDMRRQRIAMVQTVEQYMLCYRAVSTLFEQHLKLIDSHTYENINGDGEPLGITHLKSTSDEESSSEQSSCSSSDITSQEISSTFSTVDKELDEEKLIDLNELPVSQSRASLTELDVRPHEKLVGKATVIRRPSVAKLKAIFDNQDNVQNISLPTNRASRLQRSQSIKENIRNLNFNFHLEINQPKIPSRKSKSYTLSAAKLSVYKKNLSFGNLTFQAEENNSKTKASSTNCGSDNSVSGCNDTATNTIEADCSVRLKTHDANPSLESKSSEQPCKHSEQSQRSIGASSPESVQNAPPKPPRTYQHVLDDSCIVRTSEGRLIVTVAQPRQHSLESSNNFIPIGGSNFNSNVSLYDQLGARKYNISSPNLTVSEHLGFLSSTGSSGVNMCSNPIRQHYCDNNSSSIYSNPVVSKSFSRPMLSHSSSVQPDNYRTYSNLPSYVDVLSGHHFQHHQAKPIILQPNYYEPIYGTQQYRQQFVSSRPPISMAGVNFAMGLPPPRPRSISHTNFRLPSHVHENVYSNPEYCYNNHKNLSKPRLDQINSNSSNSSVSISLPVSAKEHVYSEITNFKQPTFNTAKSSQVSKNEPKHSTVDNSDRSKRSPLGKLKNAFRVFRSKSSKTNSANMSSSSSSVANSSANNGTAINPLNGQPLSRPPHSHRFQSPTQWTQV